MPADQAAVEREQRLRRNLMLGLAAVATAGIVALLLGAAGDYGARYTAVSLIGGGVGVGELVSRYRDRPAKALTTWAAMGYVLINAAAAAAALAVVLTFGWTFGVDPADTAAVVATQLLISGFGAIALFRTSLFTVRVANQDVGIGPSSLLSIVLVACDRGVDRKRATDRAETVGAIMRDVSYASAQGPLPAVALALMQNLDAPDQAALSVQLERLANDDTEMSDQAKSLLLGLAISNAVGPHVLKRATEALGDDIKRESLTEAIKRIAEKRVAPAPAPAPAPPDPLAPAPTVQKIKTNGKGPKPKPRSRSASSASSARSAAARRSGTTSAPAS